MIPSRDNAVVLFLDLQAEIAPHSATLAPDKIRAAAGVLARLTALHKLPCFVSAVPSGGAYFPEVLAAFPGATPSNRTATSAFADPALPEFLAASGRKMLILAGVASEIVVQRTALDGLAAGYAVNVLVDVCGGTNARTEEAAFRRITAAGGQTSSARTFAAELAGDFTTETGGATIGLMYELLGI